jgi:peptide deformylase
MSKHYDKILQNPNPILRVKTKDIKTIDNDVLNLLRDLKKLAKLNSKDGITLVGLSGPQVGASLSVFVYFDLKQHKYIDVINPRIIYQSKEVTGEWEGCASIGTGPSSLFGPVKRPRQCQIQFTTVDGKDAIISGSNYQSHILLHEMDHLDGVLFLDRLTDPTLIMTAKELDDFAAKNSGQYPKIT